MYIDLSKTLFKIIKEIPIYLYSKFNSLNFSTFITTMFNDTKYFFIIHVGQIYRLFEAR